MRKIVTITALVALLVAVFASVAIALDFQCATNPCDGTDDDDIIYERGGHSIPDTIFGHRGHDQINADRFHEHVDLLYGNRGPDRLDATSDDPRDTRDTDDDFDDELHGGIGFDRCFGDGNPGDALSDEYFSCEVINGVEQ